MNRRISVIALGLVFLFGCFGRVAAQEPAAADTSVFVLVYTVDGNEFQGKLLSETSEEIVLYTDLLGTLTIKRSAIRRMDKIQKPIVTYGRVWFESLYAPRYFVGTSAYGLRKGEGAYENSELFFNQVSYGFTDQFSLGLGFAPFIVFDGPLPVWVSPKFSIPLKKNMINLGIGGLFGRELINSYDGGSDNTSNFGGVYGQLTIGPRNYNITASLGYRVTNEDWAAKPIISLAATGRISARVAALAETYLIRTEYERIKLFGFGFRFMGRGIAVDAGFALYGDGYGEVYLVPYGTLHVPFGRPKN